jgi:hypothetical protein
VLNKRLVFKILGIPSAQQEKKTKNEFKYGLSIWIYKYLYLWSPKTTEKWPTGI